MKLSVALSVHFAWANKSRTKGWRNFKSAACIRDRCAFNVHHNFWAAICSGDVKTGFSGVTVGFFKRNYAAKPTPRFPRVYKRCVVVATHRTL